MGALLIPGGPAYLSGGLKVSTAGDFAHGSSLPCVSHSLSEIRELEEAHPSLENGQSTKVIKDTQILQAQAVRSCHIKMSASLYGPEQLQHRACITRMEEEVQSSMSKPLYKFPLAVVTNSHKLRSKATHIHSFSLLGSSQKSRIGFNRPNSW